MKRVIVFMALTAAFFEIMPPKSSDAFCSYNIIYSFSDNTAEVEGIVTNGEAEVVVPCSVYNDGKQYTVSKILPRAFYANKDILSVSIPETVTEIGDRAFAGCGNMETVEIKGDVQTLKQYTFSDCHVLGELVLPQSCASFSYGAFANCKNLKRVIFNSAELSVYDEDADNNFAALQPDYSAMGEYPEINGPVKGIGSLVYGGTKYFVKNSSAAQALLSRGVPSENVYIGSQYEVLKNLECGMFSFEGTRMPDGNNTAEITGFAAGKKPNVSIMLDIPERVSDGTAEYTVTSIADKAFYETGIFSAVNRITGINIPDTVTRIGKNAFQDCAVKKLTVPKSVRIIDKGAFKNCKSLTEVSFEEGIKAIAGQSFYNTGLRSVILPQSVKYFDMSALQSCSFAKSVVIAGDEVDLAGSAAGTESLESVYVHSSAVKEQLINIGTDGSKISIIENDFLILLGGDNYNIPEVKDVKDFYTTQSRPKMLFSHTGWTDGENVWAVGETVPMTKRLNILTAVYEFDFNSAQRVIGDTVEENISNESYLSAVMNKDERSIADTSDGKNILNIKIDENNIKRKVNERLFGVTWCGDVQADAVIDKNTGELTEEIKEALPALPDIKVYRGDTELFAGLFEDYSVYTNSESSAEALKRLKAGVNSVLTLNLLINPEAEFIFILPVYTENENAAMSKEACINFHLFLTEEDGKWADLRKSVGIDKKINVIAYELGNETYYNCRGLGSDESDLSKVREESEKYISEAKEYYDALSPYTDGIEYSASLAADTAGWQDEWNKCVIKGLNDCTKGLYSMHTYYGKHNSPQLMINTVCNNITDIYRSEIGYGSDIRFAYTEHALWGNNINRTSLTAGLAEMMFYNAVMNRDDIWCAAYHTFIGGGASLWSVLTDAGGAWCETVTAKAEEFIGSGCGDRIVGLEYTDFTAESGTYKIQKDKSPSCRAAVTASAKGDDTLVLTIINAAAEKGYCPVEINFDFNNKYTLIREKKYSAPNLYSSVVSKDTAGIVSVEEKDCYTENFSSYTIPPNSAAVLELKTDSAIPVDLTEQAPAREEKAFAAYTDITEIFSENADGEYILNKPKKIDYILYRGNDENFRLSALNMWDKWETVTDFKSLDNGKMFNCNTDSYFKKIKTENCSISDIVILSELDETGENEVLPINGKVRLYTAEDGVINDSPSINIIDGNAKSIGNGMIDAVSGSAAEILITGAERENSYALKFVTTEKWERKILIDFEDINTGVQSGADTVFADGKWISCAANNVFEYGVAEYGSGTDNKAMELTAISGGGGTESYPAVYYNEETDMGDVGRIGFDIARTAGDIEYGIRFMVSDDESSFYQLGIQKYSALSNNRQWILSKSDNGIVSELISGVYHVSPAGASNHFDLFYDKNGVYWRAKDINTGKLSDSLCGEYLFESPESCENSRFGFYAYTSSLPSANENKIYVDNISFYSSGNYEFLDYTVADGKAAVNGFCEDYPYKNTAADLIIPELADGTRVVEISDSAFANSAVKAVRLPEGIVRLGNNAFSDNENLVSVNIPSTVSEWGTDIFSSCTALREAVLADGLKELPAVFNNCASLNFMVIPPSVSEIDFTALNLSRLRTVIFEGSDFVINNINSDISDCAMGSELCGDIVFYGADDETVSRLNEYLGNIVSGEDKSGEPRKIIVKKITDAACTAYFQRGTNVTADKNHYKTIFIYAARNLSGEYILSTFEGKTLKKIDTIGSVELNGGEYTLIDITDTDIDAGGGTNTVKLMLFEKLDCMKPTAEMYCAKPW